MYDRSDMGIELDKVWYSFTVGMWGFLNPCGFAMLPAYVAHYLGSEESVERPVIYNVGRSLGLGLAVSAGFITLFGLFGLLFSLLRKIMGPFLPWIGVVIGLWLVMLGILMLLGKNPLMIPAFEHWAGRVSQIKGKVKVKNLTFYYFYGISYGLASLGCALPIFMAAIGYAFTGGWVNGMVQFGAYAMGMSLMMLIVSITTAFSKELIRRILPKIMIAFRWVGGVVVIGAGLYLLWYNLIYSGLLHEYF